MKVFNYSEHPALKTFSEDKLISFEEEEVNSEESSIEEVENAEYNSLQEFIDNHVNSGFCDPNDIPEIDLPKEERISISARNSDNLDGSYRS